MKSALALGSLVLLPWLSARSPQAPHSEAEVRARVLDARTLEVVQGSGRSVLTLAGLPAGARLHALEAAPLMESGTVVAVVVEVEGGFEYRYLCRRQAGEWGTRSVGDDLQASDGWWLTPALFGERGDPYRIVDVYSPGSDSFELTFRRGWPSIRGAEVRLDEVIVTDECASSGSSTTSPWVHVIGVQGRRR
jgi:hypothetical protein